MTVYCWSRGNNGNWDDASSWSPANNPPPGARDEAIIDSNFRGNIKLPGKASDAQFVGNGNFALVNGTLTLTNDTPGYAYAGTYDLDIEEYVILTKATIKSASAIAIGQSSSSAVLWVGDNSQVLGTNFVIGSSSATGAVNVSTGGDLALSGNIVVNEFSSLGLFTGGEVTSGTIVNDGLVASPYGTGTVTSALINNNTVSAGLSIAGAPPAGLVFLGPVQNNAVMQTDGTGTLVIGSTVTGTGEFIVNHKVILQQGSDPNQLMYMGNNGNAEVALQNPSLFQGFFDNVHHSDSIDLINAPVTNYSFSNQILTLTDNGSTVANLRFSGSHKASDFIVGGDGYGGTVITFAQGV